MVNKRPERRDSSRFASHRILIRAPRATPLERDQRKLPISTMRQPTRLDKFGARLVSFEGAL
jgi:hypothetical protein